MSIEKLRLTASQLYALQLGYLKEVMQDFQFEPKKLLGKKSFKFNKIGFEIRPVGKYFGDHAKFAVKILSKHFSPRAFEGLTVQVLEQDKTDNKLRTSSVINQYGIAHLNSCLKSTKLDLDIVDPKNNTKIFQPTLKPELDDILYRIGNHDSVHTILVEGVANSKLELAPCANDTLSLTYKVSKEQLASFASNHQPKYIQLEVLNLDSCGKIEVSLKRSIEQSEFFSAKVGISSALIKMSVIKVI